MHIARQTPEKLVIVSGSRWLSAVCGVGVLYTLYIVFVRHAPKGNLYVTAFLLLVALVMDLRKTFTFDAMQRVVRWKGRTVLKAESGEIAFDDIRDIGTDCSVAARNVPVYRLTIITPQGTIPMAYHYNGQPDAYAGLRGQILEFVKPGSTKLSATTEARAEAT